MHSWKVISKKRWRPAGPRLNTLMNYQSLPSALQYYSRIRLAVAALCVLLIFDELCLGIFTDQSRQAYVDIIGKLAERGADSVALVCTEIPLLVTPDVSPLPTLDSTRLLAATAVEVALGERALPTWRGGPL